MLRSATEADIAFLKALSPAEQEDVLRAQIRDGRLLIIEQVGEPAGFIKFYVLWETLPFIEVMVVRVDLRKRGIGRAAVRAWESEMARRSYRRVIVSAQADEAAQHFWRRIGYRDCGSLDLPGRPAELFLFRDAAADIPQHRGAERSR
jgi:ribosomal protein S18 acetylase RimI-like enzyme